MEPASMLCRRPRKGSRVLEIPLVWGGWLLGVRILRDLPKRPGARWPSWMGEGRSRKLCMQLSRTFRGARVLVYLERNMSC